MLADGVYDALVVDAARCGEATALLLELTIVSGAHKGAVVSVRAEGLGIDELDALGMPATLTVVGGEPTVVVDR